jgi:hypothetical protein
MQRIIFPVVNSYAMPPSQIRDRTSWFAQSQPDHLKGAWQDRSTVERGNAGCKLLRYMQIWAWAPGSDAMKDKYFDAHEFHPAKRLSG